jgi:hypothetical protein
MRLETVVGGVAVLATQNQTGRRSGAQCRIKWQNVVTEVRTGGVALNVPSDPSKKSSICL